MIKSRLNNLEAWVTKKHMQKLVYIANVHGLNVVDSINCTAKIQDLLVI